KGELDRRLRTPPARSQLRLKRWKRRERRYNRCAGTSRDSHSCDADRNANAAVSCRIVSASIAHGALTLRVTALAKKHAPRRAPSPGGRGNQSQKIPATFSS